MPGIFPLPLASHIPTEILSITGNTTFLTLNGGTANTGSAGNNGSADACTGNSNGGGGGNYNAGQGGGNNTGTGAFNGNAGGNAFITFAFSYTTTNIGTY